MAKFKIGDKVKVIKTNRAWYSHEDVGEIGTIVEKPAEGEEGWVNNPNYDYLVDFGEMKSFTLYGKNKTCRFYNDEELELIEEAPVQNWKVVILPEGDKTTALYYENGKVAKKAEVKRYFKDDYSVKAAVQAVLEKLGIPGEKKPDDKPGFDWQKFIDGDLVVRFSRKEDYVEFLKLCEEKGVIWNNGKKPTEWVVWEKNRTIVHNGFKHEQNHILRALAGDALNHLSIGATEGNFEELSGRKVPVIDWKPEAEESPFKVGDIVELIEYYGNHSKGTRGKITHIEKANKPENGYLVDVITGRNCSFSVFAKRLKKVN